VAKEVRCSAILFILLSFVPSAVAQEIPRKILALYDSTTVDDVYYTRIHQHAEMPLNYLGMDVVFRDMNLPLPAEVDMAGYRGVITWFGKKDDIKDPEDYCRWAKSQMQRGRKLVILGRFGFYTEGTRSMRPECREMLQVLGARFMGGFSDTRYFMEVVRKDSAMVEFERKLGETEDLRYIRMKVVDPKTRVYLQVRRTDSEDSDSALVFTSPNGGFAYDSYVNLELEEENKIQWRINPFHFFEEAYALQGLPRPDVTTLNGNRIFYSHIDGDGIFNVSYIDQKTYSGEVIHEEILKKNPDIPISASIIVGYLDIPQYRGEREMRLYRDMFSLPNVEVTAHGYAHPLIWKKKTVALDIPGYRYNTDQEVRGAVERERQLLKELGIAKEVTMYQWTGNCLLPPDAIASADAARVVNMNGGDSRFDGRYNSYSFVYPLSIVEGGYRQIYSSNSNENTYTDLWKSRYYGFGEVRSTFENTGTPRRVQPINIYYHYYSGERHASLEAVKQAYDYVRGQSVVAIVASHFPPIVSDYFATRMSAVPGGYRIQNQGKLRTIRFDHEKRNVDLSRSKGVVGFKHDQGSLYVALDANPDRTIILTTAAATQPYIIDATFDVRVFFRQNGGVRLEKSGWMTSHMRLGGMRPNVVYRIQAGAAPQTVRSTAKGELAINFPKAEMGRYYQEVIVAPQ
jgi:hypothetical protein